MRTGFLFLLLLSILSSTATAQADGSLKESPVWTGPAKDTIPIELVNGSLIVKIAISGTVYRFIFDTGATLSVSENLFTRAHLKSKNRQIVQDATGHIDSMRNVMIPAMKLGKFFISNSSASVLDYKKASFFSCLNIDGMIGGEIFRNCVVEINLKNKWLIISPDQPYQSLEENELPVFFDDQYNPIFNIKLNNAFELKVLFDTGAEELLTISKESYDLGGRYCMFKEIRSGIYSLAGIHNVSVSDEYKIVELENLLIGNIVLRSPEMSVVALTDISILGLDLLRYGIMRIDYRSAKIRFIPFTADPGYEKKAPFPGFSIGRENKLYVINGIEFGSDAHRHGLALGMQITKVAGIRLTHYSAKNDCRLLKKGLSKRSWLEIEFIDFRGRKRSAMLIRSESQR